MSIVAEQLSKAFGAVRGVRQVSCSIGAGELVGLLGLNGAGKTTILRMLSTFLPADSGCAIVAGFDCATQGADVRRCVGYLPETLPAAPEARLDEYLIYRARLKGLPSRTRNSEIDRCLTACHLTDVRKRLLGRLSHGMKRRVGLAEALLGNPPVLLLDEPTVGLDPIQVVETRRLLKDLAGEHTLLLSTHQLVEAEAICGRALLLHQGQLAGDVSVAELRRRGRIEIELRAVATEVGPVLEQLAGTPPLELKPLDDGWLRCIVQSESDIRAKIAAEIIRRSWELRELRRVALTLEDYFVHATLKSREAA